MRSRRRLPALLLLFAVALPTAPAQSNGPGGAEQEVREANARRFAAMVSGDTAALAPLLADELVYTHSSGQVETKAQFLDALSSGRLDYRAIDASDLAVRVYGEAATVTGRMDVQVTAGGNDLAFASRFLAVYVREQGAWRLAAWQNTRLPQP